MTIKMALILLSIVCAWGRVQQPAKHYLNVIFTSTYNADSINIHTKSEQCSQKLTTDASLGMAFGTSSVIFSIQPEDSVIFVRDVIRGVKDSVRFKPGHSFLYVSYDKQAFSFNYTKAPIFFE